MDWGDDVHHLDLKGKITEVKGTFKGPIKVEVVQEGEVPSDKFVMFQNPAIPGAEPQQNPSKPAYKQKFEEEKTKVEASQAEIALLKEEIAQLKAGPPPETSSQGAAALAKLEKAATRLFTSLQVGCASRKVSSGN